MDDGLPHLTGAAGKVTSECPPPPFYWALDRELQPPSLPDGGDEAIEALLSSVDKGEYSGVVRNLRRKRKFDPAKDYKVTLLDQLQRLLDKSLAIASHVPPIPIPINGAPAVAQHEALAELNEILVDMHESLGEYRTHEARETLIRVFQTELTRLEHLEKEVELLIEEAA